MFRLDWQKEIFNNILKSINENSKIVLNILSRVFWRSSSLIFKLDEKQANEVLKAYMKILEKIIILEISKYYLHY